MNEFLTEEGKASITAIVAFICIILLLTVLPAVSSIENGALTYAIGMYSE